jgi:hypothetical protein
VGIQGPSLPPPGIHLPWRPHHRLWKLLSAVTSQRCQSLKDTTKVPGLGSAVWEGEKTSPASPIPAGRAKRKPGFGPASGEVAEGCWELVLGTILPWEGLWSGSFISSLSHDSTGICGWGQERRVHRGKNTKQFPSVCLSCWRHRKRIRGNKVRLGWGCSEEPLPPPGVTRLSHPTLRKLMKCKRVHPRWPGCGWVSEHVCQAHV